MTTEDSQSSEQLMECRDYNTDSLKDRRALEIFSEMIQERLSHPRILEASFAEYLVVIDEHKNVLRYVSNPELGKKWIPRAPNGIRCSFAVQICLTDYRLLVELETLREFLADNRDLSDWDLAKLMLDDVRFSTRSPDALFLVRVELCRAVYEKCMRVAPNSLLAVCITPSLDALITVRGKEFRLWSERALRRISELPEGAGEAAVQRELQFWERDAPCPW